jgi:nascent polypeptide-associated complex subunit alpha
MGFRGLSPKQLERMMKKMGIEQKDVDDVTEVIIRFKDKEWVIPKPQVAVIKQAGSESYQITGTRKEREITTGKKEHEETPIVKEIEIPMEDAALVAGQAGVDIEAAKEALRETGGDLAAAILKLRRS